MTRDTNERAINLLRIAITDPSATEEQRAEAARLLRNRLVLSRRDDLTFRHSPERAKAIVDASIAMLTGTTVK